MHLKAENWHDIVRLALMAPLAQEPECAGARGYGFQGGHSHCHTALRMAVIEESGQVWLRGYDPESVTTSRVRK